MVLSSENMNASSFTFRTKQKQVDYEGWKLSWNKGTKSVEISFCYFAWMTIRKDSFWKSRRRRKCTRTVRTIAFPSSSYISRLKRHKLFRSEEINGDNDRKSRGELFWKLFDTRLITKEREWNEIPFFHPKQQLLSLSCHFFSSSIVYTHMMDQQCAKKPLA